MAKLAFDFDIEGALQDDPYLDSYTLNYMFQQTQETLQSALERVAAAPMTLLSRWSLSS